MDLLDLFLALMELRDPHSVQDAENLLQELDTLDQMQADAEKYVAYAEKHPDDPLSEIGLLLAAYTENRPLHNWDWARMREVADAVVPLRKIVEESDPDAEISMELGGLLGNDAVMKITLSPGGEIGVVPAKIQAWKDSMQKIDSIDIFPMTDDRVGIHVTFHDVRKPEKN